MKTISQPQKATESLSWSPTCRPYTSPLYVLMSYNFKYKGLSGETYIK